jgi:hypothetical protein
VMWERSTSPSPDLFVTSPGHVTGYTATMLPV